MNFTILFYVCNHISLFFFFFLNAYKLGVLLFTRRMALAIARHFNNDTNTRLNSILSLDVFSPACLQEVSKSV